MSIAINAIGAGGFGMFYGYITLYILKRYLPPLSQDAPENQGVDQRPARTCSRWCNGRYGTKHRWNKLHRSLWGGPGVGNDA